jgi:hypothetical protein
MDLRWGGTDINRIDAYSRHNCKKRHKIRT